MKLYRIISTLFLLTWVATILLAQDNNCITSKTFPVKKGTILRLSNKYGDVNILTVKDDLLLVCATVTIVQDDDNLLRKSMKLINISIEKLKDTIYVSTLYDKKFFSESSRQGRKSFSVDYLIKMPAYLNLSIQDEFGNISMDELSGSMNVRLSQGILSAKKLTRGNEKPVSSAYVDHGKIMIDELNWMTLNVYNCSSVNIGKAQALMITSAISKIKFEEISSLVSNSKSDNYSIKSVNNLVSECTYSAFEIEKLNGQLKTKATYGSIRILNLNKEFRGIDIESVQTQISLNTGENVSFRADIAITDGSVEFPVNKYPGIIRTVDNYSTTLRGTVGIDKEPKSLIRVRATSGKLTIL